MKLRVAKKIRNKVTEGKHYPERTLIRMLQRIAKAAKLKFQKSKELDKVISEGREAIENGAVGIPAQESLQKLK